MIAREDIPRCARAWLGTKFQHQASLKNVVCDCIGLVVGVVTELGLPEGARFRSDPRFSGYGRLPQREKLLAACREYMDEIRPSLARLGDILLFTFAGDPMHFAIVSCESPSRIIHAYEMRGGVVEQGIDAKWQRRIFAAFRLRGVD